MQLGWGAVHHASDRRSAAVLLLVACGERRTYLTPEIAGVVVAPADDRPDGRTYDHAARGQALAIDVRSLGGAGSGLWF